MYLGTTTTMTTGERKVRVKDSCIISLKGTTVAAPISECCGIMMNGLRYKDSSSGSGVTVKYPTNCAVRMSVDANTSALLATGGGDNSGVDPKLLDSLYEPKPDKRLTRVITVIGYIFTVSMVAILLSLYYLVRGTGFLLLVFCISKLNVGTET